MKRLKDRCWLVATALLMTGCSAESEPQQEPQKTVVVDFALSVAKSVSQGTSGTTRMASGHITGAANQVALQCAIPFRVDDVNVPIAIEDRYASGPIGIFSKSHETLPFFTSLCDVATGVNVVLAYACPFGTTASLKEKGALDATYGGYQPADISFRLHTIMSRDAYLGTEEEKTVAEQLAEYLTDIANTSIGTGDDVTTWKSYATGEAMNADLKLLFMNFTNQLSDEVGEVLPGSSANVLKWVTKLRKQLSGLSLTAESQDDWMRDAIIEKIEEKLNTSADPIDWNTTVKGTWDGFPASVNLPDGAAVVRWDGTAFVPETQTTTIADINNIDRLTYPAEIFYYGSSPTMVSSMDLSAHFSSMNKWAKEGDNDANAVLSGFTQGPVVRSTKTVAMRDPLEYGVARLSVKLKHTAATLSDSESNDITVGNNSFKVTGIIVGGQLPVGFDMSPETVLPVYSESDMRFVYDSEVNTNGGNPFYLSTTDATHDIQTLVLQSYWRKSVKLVLELENNSADFEGFNGTVYKGTKFYLVGEIVPTQVDNNPEVYDNRVFTKDHVTTMTVAVNSLAKAYNVLPNLMSPRLEMGLELTPKWVMATPKDVIL